MAIELGVLLDERVRSVAIAELVVADSPRSDGIDSDHLGALADTESTLPPIIVHRATMRVIDGIHRVAVARARGQETINVRFFEGTEADAFVLAVISNVAHGLPLSARERSLAAARIVRTHPGWSNHVIASVAGISAQTVAELRDHLDGVAAEASTRLGVDGRVRPLDSSHGRSEAAEIITRQPGLSLRKVARLAGISPETVRDVRNRLRNGQSPVPHPRRACGKPENAAHTQPASENVQSVAVRPDEQATEVIRFLLHRLRSDRWFRDSATGKTLLRLILSVTMAEDQWNVLAKGVPAHCVATVARLAAEYSRIWENLADRIDRSSAIVSPGPTSVTGGL